LISGLSNGGSAIPVIDLTRADWTADLTTYTNE